jgi:hypothetical protein
MLRFLLTHALFGFIVAGVVTWLLLASDVAQLRTLSAEAGAGILPAALLFFFLGLTFASLHMAYAVMFHGQEDRPDDPDSLPPKDARDETRFKSAYTDKIE